MKANQVKCWEIEYSHTTHFTIITKGKKCAFTIEKSVKHYLIGVSRVNSTNNGIMDFKCLLI